MHINVLGPIEIIGRDKSHAVSGQRQQALLAALSIDAGKVVPVDRLIDIMWGEAPPATARTKLQGHICALRKVLTSGDDQGLASVLQTRSSGYMLRLDGVTYDHAEFSALTRQADKAVHAGWPSRGEELLEQALALWRGPAFAGVESEIIRRAGDGLAEARLLALEAKALAGLQLRRYAAVASDLTDIVATNPLRERLRAELMLALYLLGSRADALAVYRDTRRVLTEELGLEPGRVLRQLHDLMLRDDAAIYASSAGQLLDPDWHDGFSRARG